MRDTVEEGFAPDRLALLLKEFSVLNDDREPWRVAYPLQEVLLLVVCATIASCDDFEDIVSWGEHHLDFLRRFSAFHHGVPGARWLRDLLNRIDPDLFARCLESWIAAAFPGRPDLIAIDGKTARRTHDQAKGLKALHTLSAFATNARLTLAQLSVPEKTNEITAIPDLLDTLAEAGQIEGALVTIDAMGCQSAIAAKILDCKGDYLLALKGNQGTLEKDVIDYFESAPAEETISVTTIEKGHGRIETRQYRASKCVDWLKPGRSGDGPPFPGVAMLIEVQSTVDKAGAVSREKRTYLASADLTIERIAEAVRGHWAIESMHWILDVEFKDDLSRYRQGHGAKNMAAIRRFALDLVRKNPAKGSVKSKRKRAGWNPDFLNQVLAA